MPVGWVCDLCGPVCLCEGSTRLHLRRAFFAVFLSLLQTSHSINLSYSHTQTSHNTPTSAHTLAQAHKHTRASMLSLQSLSSAHIAHIRQHAHRRCSVCRHASSGSEGTDSAGFGNSLRRGFKPAEKKPPPKPPGVLRLLAGGGCSLLCMCASQMQSCTCDGLAVSLECVHLLLCALLSSNHSLCARTHSLHSQHPNAGHG